MQLHHTDPKEFEKRVATESKKAKDLSSLMEKVNKSLESERKAYSGEFAKGLDTYQNNLHLTP